MTGKDWDTAMEFGQMAVKSLEEARGALIYAHGFLNDESEEANALMDELLQALVTAQTDLIKWRQICDHEYVTGRLEDDE